MPEHLSFSVVCPVYNEEAYIDHLLEFISSVHPQPKEVFLIDGGSTDSTVERIKEWQDRLPFVHILHNPDRYVSYALNLAIPRCTAPIIVRLDAHTEYAPDYFEQILKTFEVTGADIVGGPTRTKWRTAFQHAVALAICDPFGIGDSKVHDFKYRGTSDSVTFGAWKAEIFKRIGLFDTNLVRNQDDEFHYRARSLGFKIYQNPDIRLYYYPRNTLVGLFRQYFQYGLYKPLVLKKVRSEVKIRHLVPSLFVTYLGLLPVMAVYLPAIMIPLGLYLLLLLHRVATAHASWGVRARLLLVYPTIHIAYGLGFIMGISKVFR